MNHEDLQLFYQAEALARSGQMLAAYRLFCQVENHGNEDIEVKFWILQTTQSQLEARSLLTWLEQAVPDHPALPQARAFIQNRWRNAVLMPMPVPAGPVLLCPYCGTTRPTWMFERTSTTGWAIFVILLIFCFFLCWIGFFFRQKYCTCSRCGAEIQKL